MRLGHIQIFPIKSLDSVDVQQARILPGGALEHDRAYALYCEKGKVIRGKREPRLLQIRSEYNLAESSVALSYQGSHPRAFHMQKDKAAIEGWFAEVLGYRVEFQHDAARGFPDDPDLFGPTLLAQASLQEVSDWFPDLSLLEGRHRFRANLEVLDAPAFWEDRLYPEPTQRKHVRVGGVTLNCIAPVERCIIPARDPRTSELYRDFQKVFLERRGATLPMWAVRSRLEHNFCLSVRTQVGASFAGSIVRVGDAVEELTD